MAGTAQPLGKQLGFCILTLKEQNTSVYISSETNKTCFVYQFQGPARVCASSGKQSTCNQCPPGSYAGPEAALDCVPCAVGQYDADGQVTYWGLQDTLHTKQ